jgi:SAM-dependent methyltransferase
MGVGYCIAGRTMDDRTIHALNAINRSFYSTHAAEFDAARPQPWPGWERLLRLVEEKSWPNPLRVLDVGCGNGRFGAFLADRISPGEREVDYTGIDSSAELLARARARALRLATVRLCQVDIVEGSADSIPQGPYELIALFGLLHHVPGQDQRRALLDALGTRLARGGLLVLASRQFEAFARFRRRLIPWNDYNRTTPQPIDTGQLESGDHLLPWGDSERPVRYCHFATEQRMRETLESLSFEIAATYAADGREGNLNRYFICHFSNRQEGPKKGHQSPAEP